MLISSETAPQHQNNELNGPIASKWPDTFLENLIFFYKIRKF